MKKPYRTPWKYQKTPIEVTYTESFRGYEKKHDPPLQRIRHEIVSSGNRIVAISELFASSPENSTVEANYRLIVQAVNKFCKELQ